MEHRVVKLRIHRPSQPLRGSSLDFDPDYIEFNRALGYEDARTAFKVGEAINDDV